MESGMAELGSCLSTKVAKDGKYQFRGHQQRADLRDQGCRQAQVSGSARDPLVLLRGPGTGWGRVWDQPSPLPSPARGCVPCPSTRLHQTVMPVTPRLMGTRRGRGHLPCSVPRSAASWHAPGSWQSSQRCVRVLLSRVIGWRSTEGS